MAQSSQNQELIDRFVRFYRNYYRDEISRLAQRYPNEQRSLHVDYDDLYTFDQDLADDFLSQPEQIGEFAEEALRVYDLPADVSLGQAHVRLRNLPDTVDIRSIRVHDNHVGRLIAVSGIIRKATDVRPKITEAAFECQRCGTMTYIPQSDGGFQEPHECQGCERQGPFRVNYDQSEFVDSQKLRVQESPEGLRGGETPQSIDIDIEDDITGEVTAGDHVTVTGVLHIDQVTEGNEKSQLFDLYMDGVSVEIEDEQFEDMEISEADKRNIVELSNHPDIYEEMVASVAPSIYGYDEEKLAMILQLFSGVTKELPDGSRIRGDLHMLLIGDPGTGKCLDGETLVTLADGREVPIRALVERNLDDPTAVDDGVYDETDIDVASVTKDGTVTTRRATRVWKREAPERLYRIRTTSGREIEATPSHPLFVQDTGHLEATRADELTVGDRVAAPRKLDLKSNDTLDIGYRESKAPNAVRLDLPDRWTPRLARLVGFIIAEGHAVRHDDNTADVRITNQDDEILSDVSRALDDLGLTYTIDEPRTGTSASRVRCTASEFVSFLEGLEPAILEGSGEQRVPEAVRTASETTKREFLRAYVDGEGHVSTKQRELTVASMSPELLEGIRSLLLDFEVQSTLEQRSNGSYRLRISGNSFERYVRRIGFVTDRKTVAAEAFESVRSNTNVDTVPDIGDDLRRIRERLHLSQFDCGVPRTTYQHYERGDRNPSRGSLETIVEAFRERLDWLRAQREQLQDGNWEAVETVRDDLNLSQTELASGMDISQTAVSYYERTDAVPDGGSVTSAKSVLLDSIDEALDVSETVEKLAACCTNDVIWERIESIEAVEPDDDWVYDLEVVGTHTYLANGLVSHNSQLLSYIRNIAPRSVYTSGKGSSSAGLTAAAVRDDFGEGQQWSLEAGALVLADQGIAAVDELDKMRPEDRSAMHQALEQQEISISKAGINATLKSRCSLLGAANPKYGRFDQYEPIGEQIDLEPALISRFDLIFTVTDQPDPEEDAALAEHILRTNYAGELNTQRTEVANANHSQEEVESVTDTVDPAIDPELLRKYIAYAKRTCYPTMDDEAKSAIRDFYVDLRAKGADEDAPVPVTARKLEALVRLAEASARVRLSDTVERKDAERVIDIVRSCLQDIGVDPETGEFDADVIETGTSKSQRDRIKSIKDVIETVDAEYEGEAGAPLDAIVERAQAEGIEEEKVMDQIEQLRRKGDVYSPKTDQYKVV
ncbi:LAGLIDADG family homing endonuclease [Haloplanus salinarum]|uniref:LAGLIDADG family homing endonuclease n=1 Tax=Haloplanus salinarum TaxID=1912324 RepID=UPI00214BA636|nr:LAGLIDADG family homing endonuclease [Haloplanus salinarum]